MNQIEELKGALELCEVLRWNQEEMNILSAQLYLELMEKREKDGRSFETVVFLVVSLVYVMNRLLVIKHKKLVEKICYVLLVLIALFFLGLFVLFLVAMFRSKML